MNTLFYLAVGFSAGMLVGMSITVGVIISVFGKKEKPKEAPRKTEKTVKPAKVEKPSEYSSFGGGKVKPMTDAQTRVWDDYKRSLYTNK